ncbi:MAG: hypothetical protein GY694_16735 [Gammaproteobacteria bacterium]|nr:hypothetical protein [Gammaproteobacteria bacterium]
MSHGGDLFQSDIFDRADHVLYYIKEHGRNNVAFYEDLLRDGHFQVSNDVNGDIEIF